MMDCAKSLLACGILHLTKASDVAPDRLYEQTDNPLEAAERTYGLTIVVGKAPREISSPISQIIRELNRTMTLSDDPSLPSADSSSCRVIPCSSQMGMVA